MLGPNPMGELLVPSLPIRGEAWIFGTIRLRQASR
jgi:hypothetical protein